MDREAFITERRTGIGGSDAASALGQSAYRTKYELWAEKTGLLISEESDSDLLRFGTLMEDAIAQRYAEKHEVVLRRVNVMLRHERYPWMLAHIDRRIVGARKGVEIKNVGTFAHRSGNWGPAGSGLVPVEYELQVRHYMIVSDMPEYDLAACVGGNNLVVYHFERDPELHELIIEGEHAFWQLVESGKEPEFDDHHPTALDLAKRLHRGTDGATITLDAEALAYHEVLQAEQENLKATQQVVDTLKTRLLRKLNGAAAGILPDGQGTYRALMVHREPYSVEAMDYLDFRHVKAKKGAR
jgi:putative phage-type endonuclease